jgi:putative tricarboxylic transport membrane protein
MVMLFGLIGFLFKKLDYPLAPLVVAIVLGDDTEAALRRSLIMSHGSLSILLTRPTSLALLLLAAALFFLPIVTAAMNRRRRAPGRPAEAVP